MEVALISVFPTLLTRLCVNAQRDIELMANSAMVSNSDLTLSKSEEFRLSSEVLTEYNFLKCMTKHLSFHLWPLFLALAILLLFLGTKDFLLHYTSTNIYGYNLDNLITLAMIPVNDRNDISSVDFHAGSAPIIWEGSRHSAQGLP